MVQVQAVERRQEVEKLKNEEKKAEEQRAAAAAKDRVARARVVANAKEAQACSSAVLLVNFSAICMVRSRRHAAWCCQTQVCGLTCSGSSRHLYFRSCISGGGAAAETGCAGSAVGEAGKGVGRQDCTRAHHLLGGWACDFIS